MVKVNCKKGDPARPENYRHMCALPTLYKLFSTVVYNRLYVKLDRFQAPDQGGFRKQYRTTDGLTTYRLIAQKKQGMGNQHVDRDGGLSKGMGKH